MSTSSKEERVYRLTEELIQTENEKKETNAAYNDDIKRIKAEIKDIMDEKDPVTETTA